MLSQERPPRPPTRGKKGFRRSRLEAEKPKKVSAAAASFLTPNNRESHPDITGKRTNLRHPFGFLRGKHQQQQQQQKAGHLKTVNETNESMFLADHKLNYANSDKSEEIVFTNIQETSENIFGPRTRSLDLAPTMRDHMILFPRTSSLDLAPTMRDHMIELSNSSISSWTTLNPGTLAGFSVVHSLVSHAESNDKEEEEEEDDKKEEEEEDEEEEEELNSTLEKMVITIVKVPSKADEPQQGSNSSSSSKRSENVTVAASKIQDIENTQNVEATIHETSSLQSSSSEKNETHSVSSKQSSRRGQLQRILSLSSSVKSLSVKSLSSKSTRGMSVTSSTKTDKKISGLAAQAQRLAARLSAGRTTPASVLSTIEPDEMSNAAPRNENRDTLMENSPSEELDMTPDLCQHINAPPRSNTQNSPPPVEEDELNGKDQSAIELSRGDISNLPCPKELVALRKKSLLAQDPFEEDSLLEIITEATHAPTITTADRTHR